MRKKKILSIVMSVIMILAMVPSVAFAADAHYDIWAYNIDTGKQTVLKMMLDDGTDKPTKAEVLEKLQNTLDDDGGYLVDDDVTEDELEIKFYNGDEGNIKKMLKGKGTEYKFNKAKLRLDHIAMTYKVVEPEHVDTVSFNVYLEKNKETPAVTINKGFKTGETYEDVMPTANEIIDVLAENGIEPAAGHHFEVLTDWFGDGAWLYKKEKGSVFDVSDEAVDKTNLHTLVKDVVNEVTISFDFDGGVINNKYTEWDDLTEDAGYKLILPNEKEITKEGYRFLGWSVNGSKDYIAGGDEYEVTEDTKFTAVWEEISYVTATYDFDGGELVKNGLTAWSDKTVEEGKTVWLPSAGEITKAGYTFLGWSVNGSDEYFDGGNYKMTENTEFVAVWAEITHTVSFKACTFDGHNFNAIDGASYDDEIVLEGRNITTTAKELEGYTFKTWWVEYGESFKSVNDTFGVTDIADAEITGDVKLIAQYDKIINNYTVAYDFAGGIYIYNNNNLTGWDDVTVEEGKEAVIPDAMQREGFTFDGWDVLDGNGDVIETIGTDVAKYTVTEDVKFVAKWTPITYTVSFKAWDKSDKKFIDGGYEDETVGYNSTIATTAKDIAGYKFAGVWYVLNADGKVGDKFDVTKPITADITLVPVYSRVIVKHTVTIDLNGGTLNGAETSKEIENGFTLEALGTPTKTNRTFNGWYLVDADGNVADEAYDFATPVTEDIKLKALYDVKVEYNIYKDGFNNKTDLLKQETVVLPEDTDIEAYLTTAFGETVTPTEFDVVYKWYSRNVWTANYGKDKDIRIAAFADAETANLATLEGVQYDKTRGYMLFALVHTDENAVTITFDNVLYGDAVEPMKIVKGSALGDVAVENVKDGYKLEGWYNGTTKVDAKTTFNADTVLKAKWNVLVTFNTYKNGDFTTPEVTTEWVAVKINGGEGRFTTEAPTKGWYTKADWDKVAAGEDMTFDDITPVDTLVTAPATYYGMMTEEVNVTFSAGTGVIAKKMPSSGKVVYGTTLGEVVKDTIPTREKYQFVCWTVNGNDVDDTYVITENTDFVAKWEARDITVSFEFVNATEGSDAVIEAIAEQTIKYGGKAAEPTVTINGDEYRVDGWYNDEACKDKVDFATQTFTADATTLYAKVEAKVTLNVYTDANSLKPMVAEVFAPVNEALNTDALKTSYTNGGKVLYGWYTPENWAKIQKGGDYTFENTDKVADSFTVTEPVEFYGKVSEGFTVTFSAGEGVKLKDENKLPASVTVNYGKTVAEPTEVPERLGYTFAGWGFDFTSPIYNDTVITAKWTLNTYTITYDANGGQFMSGVADTRTISYGTEYGKLLDGTQVQRDGAKFLGWTTKKDNKATLVKEQDKYLVEDDTTLYALWEITGVSVTYVTNGGKVVDENGVDVTIKNNNEQLPYGTTVNDVRAAAKDGLKFEGWYLDEGLTEAYDNAPLTGSITLYAKYYAEITFQIYENDNYAATIGAKTIEVDEYGKVELPTAEDLGVTLGDTDEFFGWYTVDEFGKVQAGQTVVTIENVTATAEVTYCAKVLRHYTVTFNTNGGTDVNAQDVAYKGLATKPTAPTKIGNEFAGWYADADCTTEFAFETTPITADTTVYAKWNRSILTITFNMDKEWMGGTNATEYAYTYYGEVVPSNEVPVATFPGYTFDGWYLNGNAFDIATTPVTENITLDAAWHLNQFDAEIVGEYTYTGTGIDIAPEIKVTDSTTKEAVDLTANPVDVTYEAVSGNAQLDAAGLPLNAGTYKVTVSQKYAYPKFEGYKYVKAAPVELTLEVKPANISDAGRFNALLENKDGQTAYDPANLVKINFTGSELLLDGTTEEGYKLYVYDTVRKSILDSTVPDFEIEYANNVNAGTATVTVTGVGNYTGTLDVKFEIAKLQINIGPYLVIIEPDSYEYNGEAQQPNVTVKKDANSPALVYGKDFTVGYMPVGDAELTNYQPVNVGTYKVVVEGLGNYEGTTNSEPDFSITHKSIKKVDVEFVKSWDYTGEEIKPEVTVKDGGKVLVEGVDYKVSYENNVNATNEAIVRIDGLGNYNDNRKIKFTIVPKSVNSADITALVEPTSVEYTGSAITVNLTVKDGNKVLVEGTDFGTEYVNNINVGTATIKVTGLNNYKDVKEVTFEITPIDITGFTATIAPESKTYGDSAKPEVTVTDNSSKALTEGTDYKVSYVIDGNEVEEPVNAGTYTVVIKGIGNYTGELSNLTFTINQKEITADMVTVDTTEKESTGEAIKTTVTVEDGDKVLVEGTDYTVEYTNNVAPGTATVTVKGIGNYKGLVEKTFTITSKYYYVTGVVRFSSGRVIKFAKVTLTGTDYLGNSVTRTTKTDKYGKYTIKNLKKGNYIVTYRNESKAALLNEQN